MAPKQGQMLLLLAKCHTLFKWQHVIQADLVL